MKNFEDELRGLSSNELYDKGVNFIYGCADVQKNYEKALKCFIKAIDFDNARAMEQIGFMYDCGLGVNQDKSAALNWYKRAAEIGDVNLKNYFAYCLEDGDGVEKNIGAAIKWFRKSAKLGNKDAMFELAALIFEHTQNEIETFEWLLKANDDNELAAQACLADIYYSRIHNMPKAFELYKYVVDKGEDRYYTLGAMYLKGQGTEKNLRQAIKYFEKAAQVEISEDDASNYCKWDSMLKIAEIYIGLQDELTALEWLTKRNDGNKIFAMSELAHIYYGDDDFEYEDTSLIDKDKAFKWFRKLYELKDPHGTYYFAEMWESKSKIKALEIYKDGVTFGSERCRERLIQLHS